MNKVMLTAAITGAGDTVEKNENVPVTPEEIADSAIKCARAGATVAHMHVTQKLVVLVTIQNYLEKLYD